MFDLSVIAPCYNEEGNVERLVNRLVACMEHAEIDGQILLVNDKSDDRTGEIIDRLAVQYSQVLALHHPTNKGLMAGWDTGLANATGVRVCFIDADLQNPPEELPGLYRQLIETEFDMIQGIRVSPLHLKGGRYVMTKVLNFVLNTLFSMNARDNKSGFVIAEKTIMEDILTRKLCYKHFHCFIRVSAEMRGYRVGERETLFVDRNQGKSFMGALPVVLITQVLIDTAKAFFEFRITKK